MEINEESTTTQGGVAPASDILETENGDSIYDSWPTKVISAGSVNTDAYSAFDFFGGYQISVMNRDINDAAGNPWVNTTPLIRTGDPFHPARGTTDYMTLEINSKKINSGNIEMYSINKPSLTGRFMTGVRGVYFESGTNGYDNKPMIQHCAIMYKNIKNNAVNYIPLVYSRDRDPERQYCLEDYKLGDIDTEGPTWEPQRWVISDPAGRWSDPDWVWFGMAWNMKVWNTSSTAKGQCYIRKLRPIVDTGTNANSVLETDNRVIWGFFDAETTRAMDVDSAGIEDTTNTMEDEA